MKKKTKKKIIILILLLIVYLYGVYKNPNTKENKKENEVQERQTEVINETSNNLKITYLDVGQADSILIEENNEYMLIDAGNNEDGPKLVNYFKNLGITKFNYVIASHAHEDHIGGMDDIIKNFDIDTFYMPDLITTTKTFEDVLDALTEKQIAFETPTINQEFSFSDTKVTVLYVNSEAKNLNDSSIVLKLKHGTNTFLFTGDASTKVEEALLNKNITSDVLKVGHHGSKYSTSKTFLNRVNPKYAIISVGANNTYKHPHEETLNKLENNKIIVYRTDLNGTIIAESNGSIIQFKTIKTDTNG